MSRAKRLEKALEEIRSGLGTVEELRDEIDNWKTNLEGTNLENTEKYSLLEETFDTLEQSHDEIESACDELDNVEFPGMFG